MKRHSTKPAMNQKIFSMGLGVETVSLYLLCCAVADAGAAIQRTTLLEKWNGSPISLDQELSRLEDRNILSKDVTESKEDLVYHVVDERKWR